MKASCSDKRLVERRSNRQRKRAGQMEGNRKGKVRGNR